MSIIPFPVFENDAFDDFLDNLPDFDELDVQQLHDFREKVEEMIDALDNAEPRNENSEAYDDWAEKHEDLEDILDEILDCLEELGE